MPSRGACTNLNCTLRESRSQAVAQGNKSQAPAAALGAGIPCPQHTQLRSQPLGKDLETCSLWGWGNCRAKAQWRPGGCPLPSPRETSGPEELGLSFAKGNWVWRGAEPSLQQ